MLHDLTSDSFLGDPATSYSPGCSQPRCFRHWRRTAVNLAKYEVGTLAGMIWINWLFWPK